MELYWHIKGAIAKLGPRYEFWEIAGHTKTEITLRYAQYEFTGTKKELTECLKEHYVTKAEDYNTFIIR